MNLLSTPILYALAGLALIAGLAAGVQTLRLAKCQTSVAVADDQGRASQCINHRGAQ